MINKTVSLAKGLSKKKKRKTQVAKIRNEGGILLLSADPS